MNHRKQCWMTAGVALLAAGAHAQFTYNTDDLLLVFRNAGQYNLEVDLGPVSTYATATAPLNISQYTSTQFSTAMGSASGVSWAVFAGQPVGTGGTYTDRTLWLSSPRSDPADPSTSVQWQGLAGSGQGNVVSAVNGINGLGATSGALVYGHGSPADPVLNSPTALIIPATDASSYTSKGGTAGTLNSTWSQGSVENTTPAGFTGTQVSDLYQTIPTRFAPGTRLGEFDFNSDGTMTYVPIPEPGTYALIGLGGLLFLALRNRRKTA